MVNLVEKKNANPSRRVISDDEMRQKIAEEEAAMRDTARQLRDDVIELERLYGLLKAVEAERQRQGMELMELARRAEMDPGNLSRLLRDPAANPTMQTIQRLARALGKEVRVELVDRRSAAA